MRRHALSLLNGGFAVTRFYVGRDKPIDRLPASVGKPTKVFQIFSASVDASPKRPGKDLNEDCRNLSKTEHSWQQLRSEHSFRAPEPIP
jgi:hypothetical protein